MVKNGKQNFKIMLLFLLFVDIVYLLFEIAFNSSLVNLASGLVISTDKFDTIESTGKTLSGVGLGLLLFAFWLKPSYALKRQFCFLLIFISLSVPTMHFLQTELVRFIAYNTSEKTKSRAEMLIEYRDVMLNGIMDIGDEVPFDLDNSTAPDELTFLSVLPALLYNSNTADERLRSSRFDYQWLKESIDYKVDVYAPVYYKQYMKLADELREYKAVVDYYNALMNSESGNLSKGKVPDQFVGSFAELEKGLSDLYPKYQALVDRGITEFSVIIQKKDRKGFSPYNKMLFQVDKLKRCDKKSKRIDGCDFTKSQILSLAAWIGDSDKFKQVPFYTYCIDRSCTKLLSPERLVRRMLVIDDSKFIEKFGISANYKSASELGMSRLFVRKTFDDIKNKYPSLDRGDFYSDEKNNGFNDGYGANLKYLKMEILRLETLKLLDDKNLDVILYDLSNYDGSFFGSENIQSLFKVAMGDYYFRVSSLDLSYSQFKSELLKNSRAIKALKVSNVINNIAEFEGLGSRVLEGDMYAKILYVPPVAMVFSLVFSFLTIIRIIAKIVVVTGLVGDKKRVNGLVLAGFALVLVLPYFVLSSKFVSDEALGRIAYLRGVDMTGTQQITYTWVLKVQPKIYIFGNSLLNSLGVELVDHPKYKKGEI